MLHHLNRSLDNVEGEDWVDIRGYEGKYAVSSLGRVKSLKKLIRNFKGNYVYRSEKIMKQTVRKTDKYHSLLLTKDNKAYNCYVHRLVGFAFVDNPENKEEINHDDGDKSNNTKGNLKWSTPSENMQHAFDMELAKPRFGINNNFFGLRGSQNPRAVKVVQMFNDGSETMWGSMTDAHNELGIGITDISACCNGNQKTAGGFKWKFAI